MEQSFRPMRRFRQALSEEECKSLLKTEKRGTLAVIGDGGYPYALPINFYTTKRRTGSISIARLKGTRPTR